VVYRSGSVAQSFSLPHSLKLSYIFSLLLPFVFFFDRNFSGLLVCRAWCANSDILPGKMSSKHSTFLGYFPLPPPALSPDGLFPALVTCHFLMDDPGLTLLTSPPLRRPPFLRSCQIFPRCDLRLILSILSLSNTYFLHIDPPHSPRLRFPKIRASACPFLLRVFSFHVNVSGLFHLLLILKSPTPFLSLRDVLTQ